MDRWSGYATASERRDAPSSNLPEAKEDESWQADHEERVRPERGRVDKVGIQERRPDTVLWISVQLSDLQPTKWTTYLHLSQHVRLPDNAVANAPTNVTPPRVHRLLVNLIGEQPDADLALALALALTVTLNIVAPLLVPHVSVLRGRHGRRPRFRAHAASLGEGRLGGWT